MSTPFQGFRALIENSSDAISLINPQAEVLYANSSSAKVLGWQAEDLVGQNALDLIHAEDRVPSRRAIEELLDNPQNPIQWQARICRKNGSWSWIESSASNMLSVPDVQAIALNHRDINARRAEEARNRQYSEEMGRSNLRMEEFACTVAHDLQEPLRTVSMFTKRLLQTTELDRNAKEIAGIIGDRVERMSILLSDLLSFAIIAMNEGSQLVELRTAVALATKNLEAAIHASGSVLTIGPLPAVRGQQSRFVRLFQNLIGNAIKYRGADPPHIHITARRVTVEPRGPEWVVQVQDNGIGIAPEHRLRIFDPLARLHGSDISGSGIGLAVCKKTVEIMGGRIWVESQAGSGSTFCFTLPAMQRAPLDGDPA